MSIKYKIKLITELIAQTEEAYSRAPDSVLLLAATKGQPIDALIEASKEGLKNFGENYFQEAQRKIKQLADPTVTWHFIGPIQSNKTKGIAELFGWVHTINRNKIAQQLNEYRSNHLPPLNVCLQINLIDEETKAGIKPEEAAELAFTVSQFPHLKLRGLMTIPPPQQNEEEQYHVLSKLNHLMQELNQQLGLSMDTLSMGMSDDLVPAIKAGSTIVRIGRAIFGERNAH